MKWESKRLMVERLNGKERLQRKFAFFPKDLTNGTTIWLEFYFSKQIFTKHNTLDDWLYWVPGWGEFLSYQNIKEKKS
jgi:hypothetical protein